MLRVHLLDSGVTFFLPSGDYCWGRSRQNELILPHDTVSRRHIRTWQENGQWWLEDLGSTNGTYCEGELVSTRLRLVQETTIQAGKVLLILTPWKKDDVLPSQVRKPPLKLDLGDSTRNVRKDEREQIQTQRAFFDVFMTMEDFTSDFYRLNCLKSSKKRGSMDSA